MDKELVSLNISDEFVEECDALLTETVFNSKWAMVEGYWTLGKLIREEAKEIPITKFTERLAVKLHKSSRFLWYCVGAYDKYPNLNDIPGGKNVTWNKVIGFLNEKKEDSLPALPKPKVLEKILTDYLPWLIATLKQNKSGITLYMPYEKIEYELEDKYGKN